VFSLHGRMSLLIRLGGLSVHQQLHITLLMLDTKNCRRVFEYVKIIIQNIVSFFHLGYKIFDDIIIMSALHFKCKFHVFSKTYDRDNVCQKL